MTEQVPPWALQSASHSSELVRRALQAGLPAGSAGGVVPTTPQASANLTAGVAACNDLAVWIGGGMSINVNPGGCFIPGSLGSTSFWGMPTGYGMPTVTLNGASPPTILANAKALQVPLTTQGVYYCYNDGSATPNEAIATSNPSNPRIDVVVAQVEDAYYSGSNNDWKIAVVTGTPAASPTVPSLPSNCIVLAYIWVGANVSSILSANILDTRVSYNRNPFYARMYRAAALTTVTTGFQNPQFDTVTSDVSGMCTTGASSHFTPPVGGLYYMSETFLWNAAAGRLTSSFVRNGTTIAQGSDLTTATAIPNATTMSFISPLNATDTLTPTVYTTVATALGVSAWTNWAVIALLDPL